MDDAIRIEVGGRDSAECLAAITGIAPSAVTSATPVETTSFRVTRRLKSEEAIIIAGTIVLSRVLPPLVNAVRDIIIEQLRTRRLIIILRHGNESHTLLGPVRDKKELKKLHDALGQRPSKKKPR